jgi:transposase
MPIRLPKRLLSGHASFSAVSKTISRPTIAWPQIWIATRTRFPNGGDVFIGNALPAFLICRVRVARKLFPPQDRHKVLCLATTPPAEIGIPSSSWSLDDLAFHILRDAHYRDMSRSTVQRILAEAELRPHKSRYWLTSHDADFEAKVLDICRLYLQAPTLYQHGELVLCVDEKTGIQALERARPTRPAVPGHDEQRDHEYIRHGTRCLIATRVVATGQVIGSITAQRGTWDFVRHIRDVVEQFPQATRFHWVMDNLNTHWTVKLCQYLGKLSGVWDNRPALRNGKQRRAFLSEPSHKHMVHFTPKHASWMNQIEIWFSVLSRRLLRRGDFVSIDQLADRIQDFIRHYNAHDAFPYEWTYTGKPLVSTSSDKRRKRLRYRRRRLCIHSLRSNR